MKTIANRVTLRGITVSVIVGIIASVCLFVGNSFAEAGSFAGLASVSLARGALVAVVFSVLTLAAFLGIDFARERTSSSSVAEHAAHKAKSDLFSFAPFKKDFLKYWFVLLVFWLPVLAIHYPGTITFDVFFQIVQWDGLGPVTTHHPPATSFLYGLFWWLGDLFGNRNVGLFVFCTLQVIGTAAIFSFALCYARFLGFPRICAAITVAMMAVIPLYPLAAECMTKDYTFAQFFLLWTIGFVELARTHCRAADNGTFCVLYCLVGLLSILSKKPGIYIIILATLLLLVVYRKKALKAVLLGFATAITYIVVVDMFIFSLCNVQPTKTTDMWSLPLQQTARTVTLCPEEVTADEREAIDAVVPYDKLSTLYNPTISDPVKAAFGAKDSSFSQKIDYLVAWAKMFFEHPVVYVEATVANTYEAVYPFAPMDQFDYIHEDWSQEQWLVDFFLANETYPGVTEEQVRAELSCIHSPASLADVRAAYGEYVKLFSTNRLLLPLVSKGLFGFLLPLFVVGYLIYRREYRGIVAAAPVILSFLVLVASPVMQSRYFTPSLYCAVVMVALTFGAFKRQKTNPDETGKPRKGASVDYRTS